MRSYAQRQWGACAGSGYLGPNTSSRPIEISPSPHPMTRNSTARGTLQILSAQQTILALGTAYAMSRPTMVSQRRYRNRQRLHLGRHTETHHSLLKAHLRLALKDTKFLRSFIAADNVNSSNLQRLDDAIAAAVTGVRGRARGDTPNTANVRL